jgi:uncharacterized protein
MAVCICSVCHQAFDSDLSPALPFCSERCRMVDLTRWFEEGYSMPVEHDHELEEFKRPANEEGED